MLEELGVVVEGVLEISDVESKRCYVYSDDHGVGQDAIYSFVLALIFIIPIYVKFG